MAARVSVISTGAWRSRALTSTCCGCWRFSWRVHLSSCCSSASWSTETRYCPYRVRQHTHTEVSQGGTWDAFSWAYLTRSVEKEREDKTLVWLCRDRHDLFIRPLWRRHLLVMNYTKRLTRSCLCDDIWHDSATNMGKKTAVYYMKIENNEQLFNTTKSHYNNNTNCYYCYCCFCYYY